MVEKNGYTLSVLVQKDFASLETFQYLFMTVTGVNTRFTILKCQDKLANTRRRMKIFLTFEIVPNLIIYIVYTLYIYAYKVYINILNKIFRSTFIYDTNCKADFSKLSVTSILRKVIKATRILYKNLSNILRDSDIVSITGKQCTLS